MQACHQQISRARPSACRLVGRPPACRRRSRCRTSRQAATDAATPPPAAAAQQAAAEEIVTRVLEVVDGTDGGITMAPQQREQVDHLLSELEQLGREQQPRPLDNDQLWGNYNVAYTSTSRAQGERGQPAGGRFRGSIGRALFKTTGVFQSVLPPDIATNKVAFTLFGVPGAVGLRGRVLPVSAGEPHGPGVAGEQDTVRVLFEPPVLSLGDGLHFRIGPPSSVQLATTYLDERVRLGKGSRGSLFVFTRGGAADTAGMSEVGLQRSSPAGLAWLGAAFAAVAAGGWALWATAQPIFQVLAGLTWLTALALAVVVWQGGVIRDEADIRATQQLQQAVAAKQAAAARRGGGGGGGDTAAAAAADGATA